MPRRFYSDDPLRDFANYDSYTQEQLRTYPKCFCCEEPITDEYAVHIGSMWFCDECLSSHRRETINEY